MANKRPDFVMQILPMENIHGREIVESGNLCERKNGRGVDSNRNWPVHWGVQEKDYDPSEEFPGSNPFRYASIAMTFHVSNSSGSLHWTVSLDKAATAHFRASSYCLNQNPAQGQVCQSAVHSSYVRP